MKWFCNHCHSIHEDNELCPKFKQQIKQNPEILVEAVNFTTVAGEEVLITNQTIDKAAKIVNKLFETDLTYEGTQQFARDIRVFKRLNGEAFKRSGVFSSPELAKTYFENLLKVKDNTGALRSFESKLTGYAQEVDWIRKKHGQLTSLWEKSELLNDNAPGVDGVTYNRFTGKTISRTTIKASKNPITVDSTAINDVKEAIRKNYATGKDIICGPEGTKSAAQKAGLGNPVEEINDAEKIRQSNTRLEKKILNNQATTAPTLSQVSKKMKQGAVVGAVVSITVSSITNYCKYKNGEITKEEAFSLVGEDTLKGLLVGATLGGVTIFIPAGIIGFLGGITVGVYFDRVCSNVLDELFGKGGYGEVLNASGYVYGMTINLADAYKEIRNNNLRTNQNIKKANTIHTETKHNFNLFDHMKRG